MLLRRVCPGCRRVERGLCLPCLEAARHVGLITGLTGLDSMAACYRYDGAVRRLVLEAKNGGRRDLLIRLGRPVAALVDTPGFLATSASKSAPPRALSLPAASVDMAPLDGAPFDVVTWVPASHQGLRRRGYDQARVLARSVAAELGVPARRLLVRGRGAPQTGRGGTDRRNGPALRAPVSAQGRILLVDDVITSGGSLAAAGTALRGAGANSVSAVAVAWNASLPEVISGRPLRSGFARSR